MILVGALAAVTAAVLSFTLGPYLRRLWLADVFTRPWPPLPAKGFIVGRTATQADVEKGDAVFHYDGKSRVLVLPLPQYAVYRPNRGRPLRAILVQAEMAEDEAQVLGLRLENGKDCIAWRWQVHLLGHTAPDK